MLQLKIRPVFSLSEGVRMDPGSSATSMSLDRSTRDLWGWSVLNLLRLSVFFFRIVQIHVIPLISWGKKTEGRKLFDLYIKVYVTYAYFYVQSLALKFLKYYLFYIIYYFLNLKLVDSLH